MCLKADRQPKTEEVVREVEIVLYSDTPLHKEAWHLMKNWYRATVNHALPHHWLTLKRITVEGVVLYRQLQPPEGNIPISLEPLSVKESVPTKDEIE